MEALGESYGDILYRKHVDADAAGTLHIDGLHDYALVYVNGKRVGTLDRRLKQDALNVKLAKGDTLDLLVQNDGRINFGEKLVHERKGILGAVTLQGKTLLDWQIYPLPFAGNENVKVTPGACRHAPCIYRASFNAPMARRKTSASCCRALRWLAAAS